MAKPLHTDTIISVDVETTGHIPGPYSMLSLGAVALVDGKEHSHFYAKLKELPKSRRQPSTMDFWKQFPKQWAEATSDQHEPAEVMNAFNDWIISLPGTVWTKVFAANPTSYDAGFIWYYMNRYVEEATMERAFKRFRVIDIRTVISDIFDVEYSKAGRDLIPPEWSEGQAITHNALEDAREQAAVLVNLLAARRHLYEAAMDWMEKMG